jgi:hypothetical protein
MFRGDSLLFPSHLIQLILKSLQFSPAMWGSPNNINSTRLIHSNRRKGNKSCPTPATMSKAPHSRFLPGGSQLITFESDIIGEEGWVQIGSDKDEGLRIILQNENPRPREPEFSISNGHLFITPSRLGIIQQSSDLKNWTNISIQGGATTLIMSKLRGPIFFRDLCP